MDKTKIITAIRNSCETNGNESIKKYMGTSNPEYSNPQYANDNGFCDMDICTSKDGSKVYPTWNLFNVEKKQVTSAQHSPDRDSVPF